MLINLLETESPEFKQFISVFKQVVELAPENKRVVTDLVEILALLLPDGKHLRTYVAKAVQNATELANRIAKENMFLRTYLAEAGMAADDRNSIDVPNSEQTGKVFMCTFPGLRRRIIDNEGMGRFVHFVRATVELDSGYCAP